MRMQVWSLASVQWVKGSSIAVICSVGHRHGLDLALLWLWCRLAAAALIQPLAWEPPLCHGYNPKKDPPPKKVDFTPVCCSLYLFIFFPIGFTKKVEGIFSLPATLTVPIPLRHVFENPKFGGIQIKNHSVPLWCPVSAAYSGRGIKESNIIMHIWK